MITVTITVDLPLTDNNVISAVSLALSRLRNSWIEGLPSMDILDPYGYPVGRVEVSEANKQPPSRKRK